MNRRPRTKYNRYPKFIVAFASPTSRLSNLKGALRIFFVNSVPELGFHTASGDSSRLFGQVASDQRVDQRCCSFNSSNYSVVRFPSMMAVFRAVLSLPFSSEVAEPSRLRAQRTATVDGVRTGGVNAGVNFRLLALRTAPLLRIGFRP